MKSLLINEPRPVHTIRAKGAIKTERNETVLRGICCGAENCAHNNGCGGCTADEIHLCRRPDDPLQIVCESFSDL